MSIRRLATVFLALGMGLLLLPRASKAQTGQIRGSVTEASSAKPLSGVQVFLPQLSLGTITTDNGTFTIANVPAGKHTVRAKLIGYGTVSKTITVEEGQTVTITFELHETALQMEELVVTGAGVVTQKRRLGQSVETINTSDLESAPVSTPTDVLQGRVPGLVANSLGEVGASSPIRIRGTVSLSQRNGPLIYVDGVRVGNDQERFASVTTSRLDDLNPANIDHIEVLKGAAAATLYGTEASSGVIQIFTKRGTDSPPQWTFRVRQGLSHVPASRYPDNAVYDASSGQILSNNPAAHYIGNGHTQEYYGSVRGGTAAVKYFGSGWWKDINGSLPTNGKKNGGAKVNLDFQATDNLQTKFDAELISNTLQVPYPSWGLSGEFTLADPRRVDANRPYGELFHTIPGVLAYDNTQNVDRWRLSAAATYNWTDNLSSSVTAGYHGAAEEEVIFVPPGPDVRNPTGWRQVTDRSHSEITVDASTNWNLAVSDRLGSRLTVGGQSFWSKQRQNLAGARDFPGPGLGTLRGASTVFSVDETYEEVISAGLFAQEEVSLNDRLFVTGGLRIDGNSTFGSDFGFEVYPKVGASWNLSEEPFFNVGWISRLRLRSAYGTSGLQPGAYDALRTWRAQALLDNQPALTPQSFGNPDLKPERSTEIEVGGDVGLFGGRVGVSVTRYWQKTTDGILEKRLAPSKGFLTPQLVNIGELKTRGFEGNLDFTAIDGPGLGLDFHVTASHMWQKVTDLGGVTGFKVSGDTRRWNFVLEGYQPGAVVGPVLDQSDPYELTVPVENFTSLDQVVPHTVKNAAGGDSLVFMGNNLPTTTASLGTQMVLPRAGLTFNVLLRAETGFVMFDETNLIRTTVGITPTTAEWTKELSDPNTSTERRQAIANEYAQIHPQVHTNWVEPGDYLRLQEVSVSWDLPESVIDLIGPLKGATLNLSGRNLWLTTKYNGIMDPGSSSTAQTDFAQNVDYFGAPAPRSFLTELQLRF